ncbi:FAD binding domain-containing protein [Elusimicrobiota bacterium]
MKYFIPDNLKEAEKLHKQQGKRNIYFAGGTILNWKKSPKADGLIDLKNLSLDKITVTGSKIKIGAMASIQDIADSKVLPAAIVKAAKSFNSRNIRNMATAGGAAIEKFHISDMVPVFLAYNSDIEYFHNGALKIAPLTRWLVNKSGLICSIIITGTGRTVKVIRESLSAIDFPLIVTSIGMELKNGVIKNPVVAVSGAATSTKASVSANKYLQGKNIKNIDVDLLNIMVQKDIGPVKNLKASVLVKRRFIQSHIGKIAAELKKGGN